MILRCQQIPFGHAYYLSGNHYRSVRKLIGKFFLSIGESNYSIIGVYLLIITDKLKTIPIVDPTRQVPTISIMVTVITLQWG